RAVDLLHGDAAAAGARAHVALERGQRDPAAAGVRLHAGAEAAGADAAAAAIEVEPGAGRRLDDEAHVPALARLAAPAALGRAVDRIVAAHACPVSGNPRPSKPIKRATRAAARSRAVAGVGTPWALPMGRGGTPRGIGAESGHDSRARSARESCTLIQRAQRS